MLYQILVLTFGAVLCVNAAVVSLRGYNPHDALSRDSLAYRAPIDIIEKHDYPAESHEVTTQDGYILTMHRIPYGKDGPSENRPVAFLQHGLLSSSIDYVVSGPGNAFALLLADAGYDVWMGNARGNTNSRRHVSLSPDSKQFWDFSWHEIGVYDLPAMIDYVIAFTGQPQIHYAGHSQGTTSFFIMTSLRPEYNDKIRSAHMLAPVAFMSNLFSPFIRVIAPFVDQLEWVVKMMGVYEFLPSSQLMEDGGYLLCKDESPFQEVCANVLFLIGGYNSAQLNRTIIPEILKNTPAGASVGQFVHYGQGVNSAKFRQYDHGLLGNLQKYGSINPPDYPVQNIRCPVAFHFSDNDWLAAIKDVEEIAGLVPGNIGRFRVPDGKFNHLDFLWAIDGPTLLHNRVISLMDRY